MKESFWRDLYGQTVAQTAHHQRDRALLRGSATENPTYGVLCERRKCGPHHLLHLPEIQSGMENPHPQPIYTSCLTSPSLGQPEVGWSTFGSGKVGDRARDIIGTAAKQLKRMAKAKCPAMIVIY